MTIFRVLHLSDLHFAATAEAVNFVDVPRSQLATEMVSRLRKKTTEITFRYPTTYDPSAAEDIAIVAFLDTELDLILISGDISTTGTRSDLVVAKEFITATPARGWLSERNFPTLVAANVPIALLPGNHDRFRRASFPFGTGGTEFDEQFNEHWWVGQNASLLGLLKKDSDWIAFVGADFTLHEKTLDPREEAGRGHVSEHILKSLRLLTKRVRESVQQRYEKSPAVAWVVHFAPEFEGLDEFLVLENDAVLIAAAAEDSVNHILCGHTHEKRVYQARTQRSVTVHCAGAASAYKAPQGNVVQIVEFHAEQGVIQKVVTQPIAVGAPTHHTAT